MTETEGTKGTETEGTENQRRRFGGLGAHGTSLTTETRGRRGERGCQEWPPGRPPAGRSWGGGRRAAKGPPFVVGHLAPCPPSPHRRAKRGAAARRQKLFPARRFCNRRGTARHERADRTAAGPAPGRLSWGDRGRGSTWGHPSPVTCIRVRGHPTAARSAARRRRPALLRSSPCLRASAVRLVPRPPSARSTPSPVPPPRPPSARSTPSSVPPPPPPPPLPRHPL